jgi:hypothetical protein
MRARARACVYVCVRTCAHVCVCVCVDISSLRVKFTKMYMSGVKLNCLILCTFCAAVFIVGIVVA